LGTFYRDTSFLPFRAIAEGRQSLEDVAREVPFAALGVGLVLGGTIEWATLQWWIGADGPPGL
jgi:hypothetical protein